MEPNTSWDQNPVQPNRVKVLARLSAFEACRLAISCPSIRISLVYLVGPKWRCKNDF
jgi:hypothetical protein